MQEKVLVKSRNVPAKKCACCGHPKTKAILALQDDFCLYLQSLSIAVPFPAGQFRASNIHFVRAEPGRFKDIIN